MSKIINRIIFLGLKQMGIKRAFSHDPIDYIKLRKSDIKNIPKRFFKKFNVKEIEISDTNISQFRKKNLTAKSTKLILFIHGGAFISGPARHHWDAVEKIATKTNHKFWLVDYPKSPENSINRISHNIDLIYALASEQEGIEEVILIGDSARATLIMTLVQRLIKREKKLPSQLILITPVFDSSMTNKDIDIIDNVDPMLSKSGVLSAKKMCAQNLSLMDSMISPLYGDFNGFPKTTLFIGGKDIMSPDGVLGSQKMNEANVDLNLIYESEMPHIYPLLPLMKESKDAFSQIINAIQ